MCGGGSSGRTGGQHATGVNGQHCLAGFLSSTAACTCAGDSGLEKESTHTSSGGETSLKFCAFCCRLRSQKYSYSSWNFCPLPPLFGKNYSSFFPPTPLPDHEPSRHVLLPPFPSPSLLVRVCNFIAASCANIALCTVHCALCTEHRETWPHYPTF